MKKLFTILLLVVAIISASACSLMTTNSDKSDENLSKNSTPIISDSLKIKAKSNSGFTVKGSSITGNINGDSVSLYDALIIPEGSEINAFTIDENGAITGDTVMYNTPIPDVPSTSAFQSLLFMIIGVVLVGSGVGLYIYGIKKKKEI